MQAFSVDADSTKKLGVRAPGCAVDPGTAVSDILTAGDLQVKIAEAQVTQKDPAVEGAVNKRWTGEEFSQNIGLSNTDATSGKTYRVFFKFEDTKTYSDDASKGYIMVAGNRLIPGTTYYQTQDPQTNPYKFVKAADNLYYIEITGSNVGDAYSLNVATRFDSPDSAGGNVTIWGEQVEDPTVAVENPAPTCGVHKATWETIRKEPEAVKQVVDSSNYRYGGAWPSPEDASIAFDPESQRYYVKNLRYWVKTNLKDSPSAPKKVNSKKTADGLDPAVDSSYTDIFTVPEGLELNEKLVKEALGKNPPYRTGSFTLNWYSIVDGWGNKTGYNTTLYASGKPVIGFYGPNIYSDSNGTPTVEISSDLRTIKITSFSRNLVDRQMQIRFGDDFLLVKEPDGWDSASQGPYTPPEGTKFTLNNKYSSEVSYKHTEKATVTDEVNLDVSMEGPLPKVTKTHPTKKDRYSKEEIVYYRGDAVTFTIKAENAGSGPWKVNEGKPDEGKIVDSLPNAFYVTPEQMVSMFTKDGAGLEVNIDKAKICTKEIPKRTSSSGGQVSPDAQLAMECAQADEASFTISKTVSGQLSVTKNGGAPEIVDNNVESLKATIGKLVVGSDTVYKLSWSIPNGTIVGGGVVTHDVEATVKNDFMAPPNLDEASTTNRVNLNDTDVPDKVNIKNDFNVDKSAYVKNKKVDTASGQTIPAGTLVDYHLTLNRNGGKPDYAALPLFDQMSGAQILLASEADNPNLADKGLDVTSVDGLKYYVLDKPGEYQLVNFIAEQDVNGVITPKKFVADRIIVEKLGEGLGLKTTTYWYMNSAEFANPSKITVKYKTLTDPDRAGFTNTRPGHPDALNIGGIKPPKYDVTDKTEMNLSKVSADKRIVTKRGATPEQDETVGQGAIRPGEEITYRLAISHVGTEPFELSGSEIYDSLPPRLQNIKWTKDLVNIDLPTQDGLKVLAGDITDWQITDTNPATGASGDGQFITWNSSLKLQLTKPSYIYMTLKYPGEDSGWSDYRKAIGNKTIFNTWHVKDVDSAVSHYLGGDSNATLQKGVLATGSVQEKILKITKHYSWGGSSTSSGNQRHVVFPDFSSDGRGKYANSAQSDNDSFLSAVQYYAVIHNDGQSRLYLNEIKDKLPKGFVFAAGISPDSKLAKEDCQIQESMWTLNSKPCETDLIAIDTPSGSTDISPFKKATSNSGLPSINEWATDTTKVPVALTGGNSIPKKATIHAVADQNDPQQVTFRVDGSSENSDVSYDEARGKYYLNPGETLAFEYLVGTKEQPYTEDVAKNLLVMAYDDPDGSGVKINPDIKIAANPQGTNPQNDGFREILDTAKVNGEGIVGGDDNTRWLSSNVTVHRHNNFVPGVSKKIVAKSDSGGNQTTDPKNAAYSDKLTWVVTAYNDGEQPIEDYVISDVLDENYVFSGEVRYKNVPEMSSEDDGNMGRRAGTLLTFVEGSWTYADGKPDSVKAKFTNPAYFTTTETLKVTQEGEKPKPIAVLEGRTLFHINLDLVDGKLRLNVRVVPGTDGLKAPGQGYPIPGNPLFPRGGAKLEVSATNPKQTGDYKMVFNSGYVTPVGVKFAPNDVVHGSNVSQDLGLSTVTVDNKNPDGYPDTRTNPYYCYNNGTGKVCNAKKPEKLPSVRSDAVIPIARDAFTSSTKRVEEKANPENITDSNQPVNYITLPSQDSLFTYSLEVKNNKDEPLKKITLIDNLPYMGDEYSFGKLGRETQFKVDFAEDSNVVVEVQSADGAWHKVDPGKYVVEYSDQQSGFAAADWAGNADPKWSTEKKASSRSMRVRLDESSASEFTVAGNTTLRARFDAKVAGGENPDPGQIAWNTFGYSYIAPGSDLTLQAIPLKVGVRVPNAIKIQKSVVDAENAPLPAKADTTYSFVVYEGAALSADELAGKTLGDALVAGNRKFTVVDVTVPQGKSQSEQTVVKPTHTFSYENGQWKPTETEWTWQPGEQYQLAEISNNSGTRLEKFSVSSGVEGETPFEQAGQLTFTYDANKSLYFVAVNKLDKWQIDLKKVDGDACNTDTDCKALKDATFGLYSTDKSEAMAEAEVKAIGADVPATKDYNGTTYYLAKAKVSGADGAVTFDGLNGDKYFVAELKAPSGYGATWAGWEFTKPAGGQNPAATVVKNYGTYVLPKSGGIGTAIFTLTGVLLIGGAALALIYRRRNRRDD